jgi:hypothetical protein
MENRVKSNTDGDDNNNNIIITANKKDTYAKVT